MICTGPFVTRGALSHRSNWFKHKVRIVRERILDYIGPDWKLAIMPCSGTGAIEAMISNLNGNHAVCLVNGEYGQRMLDIAQAKGWNAYGTWIDFAYDLNMVCKTSDYNWMFMVHGETSTGELNDIDRVLEFAEKDNKYVAVDAVSTFGMNRIPFDNPRLGAVAFSSCKGLRGLPGVGFVAYRHKLAETVNRPNSSYYFNLDAWSKDTPLTTPVTDVIVDLADRMLEPDYIQKWPNLYCAQAVRLQLVLSDMGYKSCLPDKAYHMHCLEVIDMGNYVDKRLLQSYLWDNGIEIYNGKDNRLKVSILNLFGDDGDETNFRYVIDRMHRWRHRHA